MKSVGAAVRFLAAARDWLAFSSDADAAGDSVYGEVAHRRALYDLAHASRPRSNWSTGLPPRCCLRRSDRSGWGRLAPGLPPLLEVLGSGQAPAPTRPTGSGCGLSADGAMLRAWRRGQRP